MELTCFECHKKMGLEELHVRYYNDTSGYVCKKCWNRQNKKSSDRILKKLKTLVQSMENGRVSGRDGLKMMAKLLGKEE